MNENRAANFFTPVRFGILLALLIFAAFPQVILGLHTFIVRDFGFFVYPLAHFQRDCFWHGEIPLWNPYNNCGVPFLAQWNTMPLYPLSLIYLLLPLTWGLNFFCLLHLWFAGMGMYFLARKWTGNNFAAAFAGTMFSFNGMTLNLLMWPSHMATLSWMPWVILAAEMAWRDGGRKIFVAALVGAMQMLAGGPEIIFFTWILLMALWLLQLARKEFPRKMFWRFPAIVALVIGLAAAQLFPFLDLAAHSQREAGYADLRWSMPGTGWANLLVPMAFGHVHAEGLFFQYDQYWTTSYYLGIAGLWLALLSLFLAGRDSVEPKLRIRLLWIIGIIAFIFALGENTPVLPAVRKILPQLALVTYPVKYFLLVTFVAPLLAAFALTHLQNFKKQLISIGIVLLGLLGGIIFWATKYPLQPDDFHAALLNGLSRTGFLILFGIILFIMAKNSGSKSFHFVAPLLILVLWLDVLTHEPAQNPTVTPNVFEQNLARTKLEMNPQPELGKSRAMVSPKAYFDFIRLSSRDPKVNYLTKRLGYCGDCNLLDGVPKVDGFFSLSPREYDDVFSLIYGAQTEFPQLENFLGVSQITASDEIFHWQARANFLPLITAGQKPVFLNDADTLNAITQKDFDSREIVYLPLDQKSIVTVTNQIEEQISKSRFGIQKVEFEIESDTPTLAVIAQTYYHNWRAFVDGRSIPLLRANHAFQAVQVSQGKHRVELIYKDRAFEIGAMISIASLLGCLLGIILNRKRSCIPAG